MALLLSERDIRPVLRDIAFMDAAIDAVEAVFKEYAQKLTQQHPWTNLPWHGDRGPLRLWFASSPGVGGAVRVNSMLPGGGSAADTRFMLVFDPATGALRGILPDEEFNYARTAAPAGVGARHLAPAGAAIMGILGAGKQALMQITAIARAVPTIREVRVYSPTPANRERVAAQACDRLSIAVEPVDSAEEAARDADIVDLATNSRTAVIESGWIRPGALVIAISSNQFPRDFIASSRVFVGSREDLLYGAFRREPFLSMIDDSSWSIDRVIGDLGEAALGQVEARTRSEDTVLLDIPGMALWDLAVARALCDWADARSIGVRFQLSDV
ncbi:MAG: ornithine cyclodeaminase family protein [Dehalococcoidia bacterium]|nr:ornithine cyclodeaminase family protein [Dehalococcoidia bacterium]